MKNACLLIFSLFLPGQILLSRAQTADSVKLDLFRVGFSKSVFSDLNPTDAKAAIRVWADSVARSKNLNLISDTMVYEETLELEQAVKHASIEVAVLGIDEYLNLRLPEAPKILFVGLRRGEPTEKALLLTQRSIPNLSMLQNKRLNMLIDASSGMSTIWLNTLLLENGFPEAKQFFSDIREVNKTSQAILPVFFGQREACLVTEHGFQAMVELNPQIGRKLMALNAAPEIVPTIMFFSPGFNRSFKEDLIKGLLELHLDAKGQQVLMLFKTDRLIRSQDRFILDAQNLLEKYRRLKRGSMERALNRN